MNIILTIFGILALGLNVFGAGSMAHAASPASLTLGALHQASDNATQLTTDLTLSSPDQAISAVTVSIAYTNLRYVDASFANSSFDTELTPTSDNSGTLKISRVRLDTGFTGATGLIAQIFFEPTVTGQATLSIDKAASSLTTYADATNVLGAVTGTSMAVTALSPDPSAQGGAAPVPTTMADTNTDESGMNMDMNTGKGSALKNFFSLPKSGDTLGYARFAIFLLGLAFIITSIISWRRLRRS